MFYSHYGNFSWKRSLFTIHMIIYNMHLNIETIAATTGSRSRPCFHNGPAQACAHCLGEWSFSGENPTTTLFGITPCTADSFQGYRVLTDHQLPRHPEVSRGFQVIHEVLKFRFSVCNAHAYSFVTNFRSQLYRCALKVFRVSLYFYAITFTLETHIEKFTIHFSILFAQSLDPLVWESRSFKTARVSIKQGIRISTSCRLSLLILELLNVGFATSLRSFFASAMT